jgi:hypothetical protein
LRECRECRAGGHSAKANVGIEVLDIDVKLPGVGEDGMSGRSVQRKLGTTRGSPRRSRTAKALRISRHAVKSRCAREWGGWGRLSEDGPGHYNLVPSEGPWGKAVHHRVHDPTQCGIISVTARCTKGEGKPSVDQRMPGAGLS